MDTDPVDQAIAIATNKLREHRAKLAQEELERQAEARKALEEQAATQEAATDDGVAPWTEDVEVSQRGVTEALVAAPVEAPKVVGMAIRTVYKWRINPDLTPDQLVNGVPATISRDFLTLDAKKINETVRALKGDAQKLIGSGIEVYPDESYAHTG